MFNSNLNFLYTIVSKTMLTWNLKQILDGKTGEAPLCVTTFDPLKN